MIKEMILFTGGAAIGFGAAALILKDYYKRMAGEEVQSVMDWANDKAGVKKELDDKKKSPDHGESLKKAEELSRNYKSDTEPVTNDGEVPPYCISAEEYETSEYDKVSLDYYLQGEGLYDGEIEIKDIDSVVGSDNLVRLHGDLDIVYVRNESSQIDYEIVGVEGRHGAY